MVARLHAVPAHLWSPSISLAQLDPKDQSHHQREVEDILSIDWSSSNKSQDKGKREEEAGNDENGGEKGKVEREKRLLKGGKQRNPPGRNDITSEKKII